VQGAMKKESKARYTGQRWGMREKVPEVIAFVNFLTKMCVGCF